MKKLLLASLLLTGLPAHPVLAVSVADSRHNLSISGPGPVTTGADEVCAFCHTPHNTTPLAPAWNKLQSGRHYIPYSSSTAVAAPGQPTGVSILCLSCHDGTIAKGHAPARNRSLEGILAVRPEGRNVLGLDLSDDHPISFRYTSQLARENGELADPATLTGPVRLDNSGQLQCTSCHNAHNDENDKFLVMPNVASALCETCHLEKDWPGSSHKLSSAGWNHRPPDPWPYTRGATVAENACENCHTPHTAGGKQRLLLYAAEEDNCLACHNGNVAKKNIKEDLDKISSHQVSMTTGVHDPTEPVIVQNRHVECVDCHNAHAVRETPVGTIPGALNQVRGVTGGGTEIQPITQEYQLCFRCHSHSEGIIPLLTNRQISQANIRLEFDTGNPSFHPVMERGVNADVPSLIEPLTENSVISCGDCHGSDNSPIANGTGAKGPHGSIYRGLLVRQYQTQDNTSESPSAYNLCYSCHNRNSILADESFTKHAVHIQKSRTPCNVCHDPHGISLTQGNNTNNSHLMNFDTTVVFPNSKGELRFEDGGRFKGSCWLKCHGVDHDNLGY